jgi:hypothetical protein
MKLLLSLALCALTIVPLHALSSAQRSVIRTALESETTPELPQIAETLIREAKTTDRADTAKFIVEFVLTKRAPAARSVFMSMTRLYPEIFAAVSSRNIAANEPAARPIRGFRFTPTRIERRAAIMPPTAIPPYVSPPPIPSIGGASGGAGYGGSASIGVVYVAIRNPRGATASPATGTVVQSNWPINTYAGGKGDGSFIDATAVPAVPAPPFDYSAPRH